MVEASEDSIEQVVVANDKIEDTNKTNPITTVTTSTNNDGTADGDDEDIFYTNDEIPEGVQQRKLKHWKDSPFAVGVVNVTWWEDRPIWCGSSNEPRDIDESMAVSSIVCGCLGAGRVGNMAILSRSTEDYEVETIDEETGQTVKQRKQRPRLLWVIGPYWTVNFFITWPLILGVSGWIGYRRVVESHIAVIITWSIGTSFLILSLCMISCRNPGILHRYPEPPLNAEDWRWNDQAKTYRPPKARFDPETQVVVEGFDHT